MRQPDAVGVHQLESRTLGRNRSPDRGPMAVQRNGDRSHLGPRPFEPAERAADGVVYFGLGAAGQTEAFVEDTDRNPMSALGECIRVPLRPLRVGLLRP